MDLVNTVLTIIIEYGKYLWMFFIVIGTIDTFFLIRYGGKLKRGVRIWQSSLSDNEWIFLSSLKEDILEERKIGLFSKKKSFIRVQEGEALIRYGNPKMNTSWPVIGYVNLSSNEHILEYRLSLPMLLVLFSLGFITIYLLLFLLVAFSIGMFYEYVGLRDFISEKTDFFLVRQSYKKTVT